MKRTLKAFKPRFTELACIKQVTPEEFVKVIKENPNRVLRDYIEEVQDLNTGKIYMAKMEFGGWEITANGFRVLEERLGV